MPVGLVAFSFAHRKNGEPNPCNVRLAEEVNRIDKKTDDQVVVVCQWEVAKALQWSPDVIVHPHPDGSYLSSEDVMEKAASVFLQHNVRHVIPVANPFLHLLQCKKLIEDAGFQVQEMPIQKVGFDKQSDQWWTRDPVRLMAYGVLNVLGMQKYAQR